MTNATHIETGLSLLRQLIVGGNALRDFDMWPCINDTHDDPKCECFWEQCEAWAKADGDSDVTIVKVIDPQGNIVRCAPWNDVQVQEFWDRGYRIRKVKG